MRQITVTELPRASAGSCNGCEERASDTVIVVNLKTISFRLCSDCAKLLIIKLNIKV